MNSIKNTKIKFKSPEESEVFEGIDATKVLEKAAKELDKAMKAFQDAQANVDELEGK